MCIRDSGRVESGTLHVSNEVDIIGIHEDVKKTVVTGIEMFRKLLDEAQAGDNIGALLRGIQRTEIERGQVLIKPGTVSCHKKFTCQVYVLTKDEGGRHTPFFNKMWIRDRYTRHPGDCLQESSVR